MPVSKAELTAALSELERKMEMKIATKIGGIQSRIDHEETEDEKKREMIQQEISERTTIDIGSVSKRIDNITKDCGHNQKELEELKEQFIKLEQAFDRFRSQHAAEDLGDEDAKGEY